MDSSVLKADVLTQYRRGLEMFRGAITLCPEDEWKKGDFNYLRPAGVAYHTLECLDFYTADMAPKDFSWGYRFGVNWQTPDSETLPDQGQVLAYLSDMEQKLEAWFENHSLSDEVTLFDWAGKTILSLAIYGMRHLQHHLSEMSLELTRRGYESPDWK